MTLTNENVWLITGASRGIGLEMTRQLLQSPSNTVVSTCRDPSKANALQALAASAKGKLHVVPLDVTNTDSIRNSIELVKGAIGSRGIDYLVNNAGISSGGLDKAFSFETDVLLADFQTNVLGPAKVAQNFLPLVDKSQKKTIVNISSTIGSIAADFGAGGASYGISKAGLNMLTYKQAKERPDITAVTICPGWLKTDMGSQQATHEVSFGVEGVLRVVTSLRPEDSGRFINFKGETVPW